MSTSGTAAATSPAAELDGGDMDCGSGLLLLLTRSMREVGHGDGLLVHTREPSVPPDLEDWARLAGHTFVATEADTDAGPWHVLVRRGRVPTSTEEPPGELSSGEPASDATVFSTGSPAPVGDRLWLYSNFHCNLACGYCCSASSPAADARLLPVDVALRAADEFVALGGRELLVTGGEPFLHPQLEGLVSGLAERLPVTLLTNAMVFERGRRRQALEALPRDRVTLQVSLDSAGPELHDRHRGAGSHARALAGIGTARSSGFRVRVAATLFPEEADAAHELEELLDVLEVAARDRLVRPVAAQGAAERGVHVTVDSLEPEPTLAVDGVWWHPVAVTDPTMKVADAPLPLGPSLDVVRDAVAVRAAARSEGRTVFRCA